VRTEFLEVAPGQAAGVHQIARGLARGAEKIYMELQMYVGAKDLRDAIELRGTAWHGTSVHTLLEDGKRVSDPLLADRPALSWLAIPVSGSTEQGSRTLRDAVIAGDLGIPQVFARHVYDELSPGATLVITDEPIRGRGLVLPATLMEASDPPIQELRGPGD